MYCEFFGFKEHPFAITPNPRFIFLSKSHREAFAHLLYGINNHVGFIELSGEVGSGKTTILRALLGQLDDLQHRTALIFNPRLSAIELLRSINREYGIQSSPDDSIDTLLHALYQFLLQENAAGKTVVLVIDEAQNLDPLVLEQIRLISNLETETDKLIQIVLAGQPELEQMLEREDLRQLNQRITVRFRLGPLDYEDTLAYIQHRLEIAGGWRAVTISPDALKKIFRYTQGLPRLVNVLCDRVMLIAYTEEAREITRKMVAQAIGELRRESRTSPAAQWAQRLLAAAMIATALIVTGIVIGQQLLTPAQPTVQPDTLLRQGAASAAREAVLGRLKTLTEVESAIRGFNELAALWQVRPVAQYHGKTVLPGLESVATRRGLTLLHVTGGIADLLRADTPCLLELKLPGSQEIRYLPLIGCRGDRLLLGAPARSGETLTAADLKGIWTGKAIVPWRSATGISGRILPGAQGPEVLQLQKLLARTGTYGGTPSGTFDAATQEAIRVFQAARKLTTDGVPGPSTLLFLYRANSTPQDPRLTPAGRS